MLIDDDAQLATAFTGMVGCRWPIQMVGIPGIATAELVAAVSNAGGLGMLSAAMLEPAQLDALIDAVQARTDRPFGVNFLIPFLDRDCLALAARRVRLVEFFYGTPGFELVRKAQANGALCAWQTGSVAEAELAARAGCDVVILQGVEAGGHIRGKERLASMRAAALARVSRPLLFAGGIASGRDLAEALTSGAAGVRIGTRFVTARESGVHPQYAARLLAAQAGDTVITERFSVMWPDAPHRVLASSLAAVEAAEGDAVGEFRLGDRVLPVPRGSVLAPDTGTTGNVEAMALYAGESVGAVHARQAAADIIATLVREAVQARREADPP